MSEKKRKSSDTNPGKFMTRNECAQITTHLKEEVKTIKRALFGEDMRGGMVKDVQEIKSATSFFKSILVPIIISVASALITAYIVRGLH